MMIAEDFYISPKKKVFKKSSNFGVRGAIPEILEVKIPNKITQKTVSFLYHSHFSHITWSYHCDVMIIQLILDMYSNLLNAISPDMMQIY